MWKFLQYGGCKTTNYLKDIAFILFMFGALSIWAFHNVGFASVLSGGILCSLGTVVEKMNWWK